MEFDKKGNLVLGCHNYVVKHPKWWQDEIDEAIKEVNEPKGSKWFDSLLDYVEKQSN